MKGWRSETQSTHPMERGLEVRDIHYVYMTLKKVKLLAQLDYDWITKMPVNTLVELKSNRIGLPKVEFRHLDNSIRSRAKRPYTEWDWVMC